MISKIRRMLGSQCLKQAIILRSDVGMGKGKLAAQAAHASLQAYKEAMSKDSTAVHHWESQGCKKVVLRAGSEGELLGLYEQAKRERLPCALIADAGHTQIEPGTLTALAIGPAVEEAVDKVAGKLKLL